jgi:hypothetical protein
LDPNDELAGDIGAAFAVGANVGTAISAVSARAAISAFMVRLHMRMRPEPVAAIGLTFEPMTLTLNAFRILPMSLPIRFVLSVSTMLQTIPAAVSLGV